MEVPKNLDSWFEDGSGPVVLVVQPKKIVGGQSSITHMLEQPYAMMFPSYDVARKYYEQNKDNFRNDFVTGCYPVFEKHTDREQQNESSGNG